MEKIIRGVTPFTEVYYKSCNYNPLLSAVYHFGGSILPFLAHDLFIYLWIEELEGLKLFSKNIKLRTDDEILLSMGIRRSAPPAAGEVLPVIEEAISAGRLVFLTLDQFANPAAPEYQKSHKGRYVLVYGFNDSRKVCYVVDVEDEACFLNEISYALIPGAYRDYLEHCKGDHLMISSAVIAGPTTPPPAYRDILGVFTRNMLDRREMMRAGLAPLRQMNKGACSRLLTWAGRAPTRAEISAPIFFFIRAKHVEAYRVKKFFGTSSQTLLPRLEIILDIFDRLHAVLLKTQYRKKFADSSVGYVFNLFTNLYETELEFQDQFFQVLKRRQ